MDLLKFFRRPVPAPSQPVGPTADQLLLTSFLDLERSRLERRGELEAKRDELEVRKLELELNHMETRTRMDIETAKAREELRSVKRENAKNFMRKKRAGQQAQAAPNNGCPLCVDPSYRAVTVPMVMAHQAHEVARAAQMVTTPDAPRVGHIGWTPPGAPEEAGN